MAKHKPAAKKGKSAANPVKSSSRATVSGPSMKPGAAKSMADDALALKAAATAELAAAFPYNAAKAAEFDAEQAHNPPAGQHAVAQLSRRTRKHADREQRSPAKVGDGSQALGINPNNGPLDRVRVDSPGQPLTTNQGVLIADNQNSLKAGLRGPSLLEDFILREKITHFDHERIPERVVHARGSGAHGYFEVLRTVDQVHARLAVRRRRASARRCSCASPRSPASAARPTRRAMCAASP